MRGKRPGGGSETTDSPPDSAPGTRCDWFMGVVLLTAYLLFALLAFWQLCFGHSDDRREEESVRAPHRDSSPSAQNDNGTDRVNVSLVRLRSKKYTRSVCCAHLHIDRPGNGDRPFAPEKQERGCTRAPVCIPSRCFAPNSAAYARRPSLSPGAAATPPRPCLPASGPGLSVILPGLPAGGRRFAALAFPHQLEGLNLSQGFADVPAYRRREDLVTLDRAVGVDDEASAIFDAGCLRHRRRTRLPHAAVGQREGDPALHHVAQLVVIPHLVDVHAVDADGQNFDAQLLKLRIVIGDRRYFGRSDKGEIARIEAQHNPLAQIIRQLHRT